MIEVEPNSNKAGLIEIPLDEKEGEGDAVIKIIVIKCCYRSWREDGRGREKRGGGGANRTKGRIDNSM